MEEACVLRCGKLTCSKTTLNEWRADEQGPGEGIWETFYWRRDPLGLLAFMVIVPGGYLVGAYPRFQLILCLLREISMYTFPAKISVSALHLPLNLREDLLQYLDQSLDLLLSVIMHHADSCHALRLQFQQLIAKPL